MPLDDDPVVAPGLDHGARFGRYEVLGPLGAGGMGLVFRVRDPELRQEFALKVLKVSSPERRARFVREGRLTAALRHPGIVRIHTAGEVDGKPYLLYELVEGSAPLNERLREASLDRRLEWVLGVARAVGHAHAEGVVHRDLKAENVLIDAEGLPRVIDFGLAFAEEGDRLTRTGATPGTPRCMAPEQISGENGPLRVAPTVDVWALGVLLYRCLCEEYPFQGGTLFELAAQVCGETPTPPRELSPRVSAEVEAVCLRALSKDPQRRFPDADGFADALLAALDGTMRQRTTTIRWALVAVFAAVFGVLGVVGLAMWHAQASPTLPATPDPGDPGSNAEPDLSEFLGRARRAWERRDFAASAEAYALLVEAKPRDPELRVALAATRYRSGATKAALGDLQAAVELSVELDAEQIAERLEAWAKRGWVRFGEWGPSEAPRVFDPTPYDFTRPWPGEDGVNVNLRIARSGAVNGSPHAQAKLGSWLQKGKWIERDAQASGQILQALSWAGHADAQYWFYELLSIHYPGWTGDPASAEVWFQAALAQGDLEALEEVELRKQRGERGKRGKRGK